MAAHLSAAYSCPHVGYQESSTTSLLSRIWGSDNSSAHGLSYHDEMDIVFRIVSGHTKAQALNGKGGQVTRKTSRESTASTQDTLARIKGMPLEILYEIFIYLKPADLLSLCLATRGLREILLNKRSRFVWKACLANVRGLPSCPPDMTEPQFARLVFSETCHFCGADGVKDILWSCNVRCCSECIKKEFIPEERLDSWIPEQVYIEKLNSVFPYIVVDQYQSKQSCRAIHFHPIAAKYVAELKDVVASQGADGTDAWLKTMKENQIDRLKHASACEHWHNHWVIRTLPSNSHQIPVFDLAVTAVLSTALIYLWKDRIFG